MLYLPNRRRTESEDSGISVTNTEDEMKKNKSGNEVLNDEKNSKDNLKQIFKKSSHQRVKIDKEESSEKNQKSDQKANQKLDQKTDQKLKKKPDYSLIKNQIKNLKDVGKLLSKTSKSIVIPQRLTKKLVFVPEFDKMISFNLVKKKLDDLLSNLDNVKETLILNNKQLNHLTFAKSSQSTNSNNVFNVLIELANDQQVDLTISKLNNLNKELNVVKILEKRKKINHGNDLKKEDFLDESELSLNTRSFRSNTFSGNQISIKSKLKYNKKRNSLDASVDSNPSNEHKVIIPRNGHLIREPFGPGSNNFETRLKGLANN